jgi:hypothetical protein
LYSHARDTTQIRDNYALIPEFKIKPVALTRPIVRSYCNFRRLLGSDSIRGKSAGIPSVSQLSVEFVILSVSVLAFKYYF